MTHEWVPETTYEWGMQSPMEGTLVGWSIKGALSVLSPASPLDLGRRSRGGIGSLALD